MKIEKSINPRFERTFKVYKHVCPNGKIYIGITSRSLNERWQNGKGYKGYFRKAIDKYGWDNIKHYVLKGDYTESEAKAKEIELIAKYQSNNPEYGYNLTSGGDGTVGFHQPEHVKQAVSNANRKRRKPRTYGKGRTLTEEHKEAISKALKGREFSETHKSNIAKARTGKKASKETREKLSKAHSNISDETRRKISEACKGEKNGFYGKHHSEEAKLKMRLAWERRRCQ